jgi:hypothetical protein
MRKSTRRVLAAVALTAAVLATTVILGGAASAGGGMRIYRITLVDLTAGQPLSPPVFATHDDDVHMFRVGRRASDQLAAIAQAGDPAPMAALLGANSEVTDVEVVPRPLTSLGTMVGDFNDSVVVEINAKPGDRLSLATMLICTNDGFTGLDSVWLPAGGSKVYTLNGYDAGREWNTERSRDLVDPCSGLNPGHELPGDPDGNRDAEVENDPARRIKHHPGIRGDRELDAGFHGWTDPVAIVVVTRVA